MRNIQDFSDAEIINLLEQLEGAGVGFSLSVPNQWGAETTVLVASDAPALLRDPTAFFARVHGVTVRQHQAWIAADFSVQCAATTAKGKQCKNTVCGGFHVSAKKWVDLQGAYCVNHGGERHE